MAAADSPPLRSLPYFQHLASILSAALFLVSALNKLTSKKETLEYMSAFGVPAIGYWPAVVLEITCGISLLLHYRLRDVGLVLAGWCLLTASIFHTAWADPNEAMHFFKNLAMAGAFLGIAYYEDRNTRK